MTARSPKIELFPEIGKFNNDSNAFGVPWSWEPTGQWLWRLVGGNGQTVCVSEAYTRKRDAKRAAERALNVAVSLYEHWRFGGIYPFVDVES